MKKTFKLLTGVLPAVCLAGLLGLFLVSSVYALDSRNDEVITGHWNFEKKFTHSVERSFNLPITAAYLDGYHMIEDSGTTNPQVKEIDHIAAIVWASPSASPVNWTFRVPDDYSTGLGFRVLASESSDTTPNEIDWLIKVNYDAAVFDNAAGVPQAAVTLADCAATNEEVDLVVDATGLAQVAAGRFVTLDIWRTMTGNGDLEVKGVEAYYTAKY